MTAFNSTFEDIIGPRLNLNTGYGNASLAADNNGAFFEDFIQLPDVPSVDIVITSDPSKWSRCLVVETSPSKSLSTGANPLAPRWATSLELVSNSLQPATNTPLDPNGDRLTQQYGFSYFPGYAIDVDRGVRLNIFFGESSWHRSENGADMLWNPTASFGSDGKAIGGRHYIYVTNQAYDGCASLGNYRVKNSATINPSSSTGYRYNVNGVSVGMDSIYKHVAWTAIPLVADEQYRFTTYDQIPCDARISLRVNRSFRNDPATNQVPTYEFNTSDLAVETDNAETARRSVMEDINIVPNPFYGRSGIGRGSYETAQLDTRAKLTNLPQKCTIRIFTLNGQLVRTISKENELPDQDWDMRNDNGVPVASGLYIVHIDAGDLGEKILKFFCILPELDLNAY
jgi:hypothetical protein